MKIEFFKPKKIKKKFLKQTLKGPKITKYKKKITLLKY